MTNSKTDPYVNQIIEGDSIHILKEIETDTIDCIVTDPPYGYSFMNKDWDKAVVSVDIWKECLRVLKAGSFAFIMSSPRQDVLCKMILNLIDVGFETNFTSIYWTYASGFPKAANVSKLVDKRLGVKRDIVGYNPYTSQNITNNNFVQSPKTDREHKPITISKSEQAKKLDGSYAGFQPKPALETILVVMKPLSEKSYVDQALSNCKGISWLDDCRIPITDEKDIKHFSSAVTEGTKFQTSQEGWDRPWRHDKEAVEKAKDRKKEVIKNGIDKGRFPANLCCSSRIDYDINELLQLQDELKNA